MGDPNPTQTRVVADKEWVQDYYGLLDEEDHPSRCSQWLLRIQLDKNRLTEKRTTVEDVGECICLHFSGDLDVIFTDDCAEDPVVRIRLFRGFLEGPTELEAQERNAELALLDLNEDGQDEEFKFLQ